MTTFNLSDVKSYPISTVQQLFQVPPPEMLVEEILPKQCVAGLTAFPGVGKTWLALDLARAVATGGMFLKYFPTKQGNVVFVGQDSSIHDYARQLRKLIQKEYDGYQDEVRNGGLIENPFDDRLHFLIEPGFLLERSEDILRMIKTIREIKHTERLAYTEEGTPFIEASSGTDLVVFDTYASMTRIDQNNNSESEVTFRNLRTIASATGATILLIHHNSKPTEYNKGEDWRGASSQIAALDAWFHIMKPPRAKEDKLLFKVKRIRGLRPPDFHYYLRVDENEATLQYAIEDAGENGKETTEIKVDTVETLVSDYLFSHKGEFFKAADIANDTWTMGQLTYGGTQESYTRAVRRALRTLVAANFVEVGPKNTYRLVEVAGESGQSEPSDGDDFQGVEAR